MMGTNLMETSDFLFFAEGLGFTGITDVVFDGEVRRCRVFDDKYGERSGWYVLHESPTGYYGTMGNWKTSKTFPWSFQLHNTVKDLTEIIAARDKKAKEDEIKKEQAASHANDIWNTSTSISLEHKYVVKKKIKPYNVRMYGQDIIVPLRNKDGEIRTIQKINPSGSKRFLTGGEKKGNYWAVRGSRPYGYEHIIGICEGWATACTIRELIGVTMVAAMDSGNLLHVARTIEEKMPNSQLVIFADNDTESKSNPGLTAAKATADELEIPIVIPDFKNWRCQSDWNDYADFFGKDKAIEAILNQLG